MSLSATVGEEPEVELGWSSGSMQYSITKTPELRFLVVLGNGIREVRFK